jgi:hypothetical protein
MVEMLTRSKIKGRMLILGRSLKGRGSLDAGGDLWNDPQCDVFRPDLAADAR